MNKGQADSISTGVNPYNGIYNYGSHKKGTAGGTNAVRGDMCGEWIEGTRIGWP